MKKILFFTRPLAPPWDEASKNLAHDLALNCPGDFEFELLTTKEYSKKLERQKKQTGALRANPIFKSTKFGFFGRLRLLVRLFRVPLDADIVHFPFTLRSLTSWLIKFRLLFCQPKTVQTIAVLNPRLVRNPKRLRATLFGDQIISQSKSTENKLRAVGIENVQTVYPGIDLEKFSPRAKSQKIADQLGIKSSDLVILYAGEYLRLGQNVIDEILAAFEILEKNRESAQQLESKSHGSQTEDYSLLTTHYKLIIACRIKSKQDQEKKQALIEKIRQKSYHEKVIFWDFCDDMPGLYGLSDINIFPAHQMTGKFDIPFVILEAMAQARPVIVSDLEILKEFIKDGKTGLVAKKSDPEALARAMERLAQSEELRKNLGQNAKEYIRQNFDIKKTAQKYSEIYEKL